MQTITLKIIGMTCSGCTHSVKSALTKLPGVIQVEVLLDSGQTVIQHDQTKVNQDQLKAAIIDAGFEIAE